MYEVCYNSRIISLACLQSEQETLLEQREQQCFLEAERLRCEREELEAQLLEYQQNLDRLREGQRSVEREKEKIEAQQRLLQSWRHSRQSSLPVMIPLGEYKVIQEVGDDTRKCINAGDKSTERFK